MNESSESFSMLVNWF